MDSDELERLRQEIQRLHEENQRLSQENQRLHQEDQRRRAENERIEQPRGVWDVKPDVKEGPVLSGLPLEVAPPEVFEISDDEASPSLEPKLQSREMSAFPSQASSKQVTLVSRMSETSSRKVYITENIGIVPGPPSLTRVVKRSQSELSDDQGSAQAPVTRSKRARAVSSTLETSNLIRDLYAPSLANAIQVDNDLSTTPGRASATRSPDSSNVTPLKKEAKTPRIKKDAFVLPVDVVNTHLSNVPHLEIQPPPMADLYVSRKFLSKEYGGNTQNFVVRFPKTGDDGRERRVVFPQLDMNPFLPTSPGRAGLIFSSRPETAQNGPPWTLFCKNKPSGAAVWLYMGEYEFQKCGSTTGEQFASQAPQVKQRWANHILEKQSYIALRARIGLRKNGVAFVPGDDHVDQEMENLRDKKGKKGIPLTPEEVIQALCNGDEGIGIIQMKCVSYDHEFIAEMARRHDAWNTVAARAPEAGRAQRQTRGAVKGKSSRKRPSNRTTADEDSDCGSNYSAESEAEGPLPRMGLRRRKKNSRLAYDEEMSDSPVDGMQ